MAKLDKGLKNTAVLEAENAISYVDPESGQFYIRGIAISEILARKWSYEDVAIFAITGAEPSTDAENPDLKAYQAGIREAIKDSPKIQRFVADYPVDGSNDALIGAASKFHLSQDTDPLKIYGYNAAVAAITVGTQVAIRNNSLPSPLVSEESSWTAKNCTFLKTAWASVRSGKGLPTELKFTQPTIIDVLCNTADLPNDSELRKLFETLAIMQSTHGSNASEFAAYASATTLNQPHQSLAAAYAAHDGNRHGGANRETSAQLDALRSFINESPADEAITTSITAFIDAKLNNGDTLSGFGHAVHKIAGDGRAILLRELLEQQQPFDSNTALHKNRSDLTDYELAMLLMQAAEQHPKIGGKGVFANVDYLMSLIARKYFSDLGTPFFGMSRSGVGYAATHYIVISDLRGNPIVRPQEIRPQELELELYNYSINYACIYNDSNDAQVIGGTAYQLQLLLQSSENRQKFLKILSTHGQENEEQETELPKALSLEQRIAEKIKEADAIRLATPTAKIQNDFVLIRDVLQKEATEKKSTVSVRAFSLELYNLPSANTR